MVWVKLDDGFMSHPRMVAAGLNGRSLFIAGLCYCGAHLTDGMIPKGAVRLLAAEAGVPRTAAKRLVEVGSWIDVGDDYEVHDFLVYNPTREKVLGDRELSRRRWTLNNDPELRRTIQTRDGDNCRYCGDGVNWRDRKGAKGATYDHVIPVSRGGSDDAGNIVVCCRACNTRKGAHSPEQAGMPLRDLAAIKHGSGSRSGHPSRPVPTPTENSSPNGSDRELPSGLWMKVAEEKLKLQRDGAVANPLTWLPSTARNAELQLATLAASWFDEFDLSSSQLACALATGKASPTWNCYRRSAS